MNERELFLQAVALETPAERDHFLNRLGERDPNLRRRLIALLAAHSSDRSVLDSEADELFERHSETAMFPVSGASTLSQGPADGIGSVIGNRYQLIEVLGQGGMGTVYRATQTEPVRRTVAVKLIRTGSLSEMTLDHFRRERQSLASMNHPNIAQVFDGGTTTSGQPYFVMEYIPGVPITRYCDDKCLGIRDRVQLFRAVCLAVHHAHQKGIIHRDLKPNNILVSDVDGRAIPRVIDFGVAKALHEPSESAETFRDDTANIIVGTPEYMSPEQADPASAEVDTRTDVYSLGIILYELLVGTTPILIEQLKSKSILEILQIVRAGVHETPSNRLRTTVHPESITTTRSIKTGRLQTLLRNELDWIVLKSMSRPIEQRYDSANDLADDLQRFLSGDLVRAVPSTKTYRIRKFFKRYPGPILAASLIFLTIATGIVGTTIGMFRAKAARNAEAELRIRAEQAADAERAAQAVAAKRLVEVEKAMLAFASVFSELHPNQIEQQGKSLKVAILEKLEMNARFLEQMDDGDPRIRAKVLLYFGRALTGFGNDQRAWELHSKARTLCSEFLGEHDPLTLEVKYEYAACLSNLGRHDESIPLLQASLSDLEAEYGPDDTRALGCANQLALTFRKSKRLDKAIELYGDIFRRTTILFGPEDFRTLMSASNLAAAQFSSGNLAASQTLMEETHKIRIRVLGPEHPDTLMGENNLAVLYQKLNRNDLAIPRLESLLAARKRVIGASHPDTLSTMHNLGLSYYLTGRRPEGVELFEELLRLQKQKYPPKHPDVQTTTKNLAGLYKAMNLHPRAQALMDELGQTPK